METRYNKNYKSELKLFINEIKNQSYVILCWSNDCSFISICHSDGLIYGIDLLKVYTIESIQKSIIQFTEICENG